MMDNMVLVFLEAYKILDELCKQIFSSDRGISEYIDEMNTNEHGHTDVSCWDKDYWRLKRLRWIRNKLVHESNSFEDDLFSEEDIIWLKTFRSRIINRTDPLALLYQIQINRIETSSRHDKDIRTETSARTSANQKNSVLKSVVRCVVLVGIILCVIMLCLLYLKTNE